MKIIPFAAALALGAAASIIPATPASAVEAYCKENYHYISSVPLRKADGTSTPYRLAVFSRNTGGRIGAEVWLEHSHRRMYVKLSRGSHKIKSDAGIGSTDCVTIPVTRGTYYVYGSVAKRKGAPKIASNRVKVTIR